MSRFRAVPGYESPLPVPIMERAGSRDDARIEAYLTRELGRSAYEIVTKHLYVGLEDEGLYVENSLDGYAVGVFMGVQNGQVVQRRDARKKANPLSIVSTSHETLAIFSTGLGPAKISPRLREEMDRHEHSIVGIYYAFGVPIDEDVEFLPLGSHASQEVYLSYPSLHSVE